MISNLLLIWRTSPWTLLYLSHQSLDYFFVECEWFPIFSVDKSISWPPFEGLEFFLKTTYLDEES